MIIRILILMLAIKEHDATDLAFGSDMYLIQNMCFQNIGNSQLASRKLTSLSLSLLLFSIVKIGLQQFSWTTDTWDIR
jgi:hypothetical protein